MTDRGKCMRSKLLAVLLGTVAIGGFSSVAHAQDGASASLSDIIVTAQRKAENLQNVPVAVTAFSADSLDEKRILSANDLGGLVPSLQTGSQAVQSNPNIMIRGITIGASNSGIDPKIGIYLDGVYIGRTVGSLFDMADIERIEVLRGPQGTLFGRNATAGAISLTSGTPTGEWGFRGSASVGNNKARRFKGSLDLPAFGPLSLKVSYLHDEIDGYVENLMAGKTLDVSLRDPAFGTLRYADKLGKRNTDAIQVGAHLDLDNVTVDYRFDWTDTNATPFPVQSLGPLADSTGQLASGVIAFQPIWGGFSNQSPTFLDKVASSSTNEHVRTQGHSLTVAIDANDSLTVKSITGFRKFRQDPTINDLAASGGLRFTTAQLFGLLAGDIPTILNPANFPGPDDAFFTLLTGRSASQKQFSQELQLQYGSEKVDLTAGSYYFYENSPSADALGIFEPEPGGVVIPNPMIDAIFGGGMTSQRAINKSLGAYGQLTYHLTDTLDVTGGLRYTSDSKRSEIYEISFAQGAVLSVGNYKANFQKLTWAGILTWQPNQEFTGYAKASTGYVSGGVFSGKPYLPETLTTYEIGLKSQFLDNRVRANIAMHYSKYKDLQTQNFINGVQYFENAGKAEIKGVEVELTAVPVTGLTLSGMLSYTDYKYKKYIISGVDVSSYARPAYYTPWLASVAAQYNAPAFSNGANFFLSGDVSYKGKMYLISMPLRDDDGNIDPIDDLQRVGKRTLVNARVGLANIPLGGANATLSAFGNNLFDKHYISFGASVMQLAASYDRGRTYGIELGVKF